MAGARLSHLGEGPHAAMISIDSIIGELRRELGMRKQVFPRQVREGRLNAREAAFRHDAIEDAIAYLQELQRLRGETLNI